MATAGDWPQWRHDAGHGAVSSDELTLPLHLQWTRDWPAARPAWPPSQSKLHFDASYEPVVAGQTLVVGSMNSDRVTAYDTRSGEERWRFYTAGPVRFAPIVHNDHVYAASDDGHLYCLALADGGLVWKFDGRPAERPILGNERMISTWPVRGGPVLADGTLYFTNGIWPSLGIFVHAVDADTGSVIWTNSKLGLDFTVHPHGAAAFGSVVPQGYLAVAGDRLIVPGGRSLPAVLDRQSGELVHFDFGGKTSGGYELMASDEYYIVRGEMFRLSDGTKVSDVDGTLVDGDWLLGSQGAFGPLLGQTFDGELSITEQRDRRGRTEKVAEYKPNATWRAEIDGDSPTRPFAKAGRYLFSGATGRVACFDAEAAREAQPDDKQKPIWTTEIEGAIWTMLAADDRLFVVTTDGRLYCFGAEPVDSAVAHNEADSPLPAAEDIWQQRAAKLVEATGLEQGYATVLGIGSGQLIRGLLQSSQLHVIVIDDDADAVDRLRRELDDAGLYGQRVAAVVGDPATFRYPPYLSSLIATEDASRLALDRGDAVVGSIYQALRPYGGVIWAPMTAEQHAQLEASVSAAPLEQAEITRLADDQTLVRRQGALPGAGAWTHQYADATNSVVSDDTLVQAPLGILWFGGPDHEGILPRHGHGPSPQVAGGRAVIEGTDFLRAIDVYTGRLLWQASLPGVGTYYDNLSHFPGASEIGSNYVTLPDRVYVSYGPKIVQLDAATGETLLEIEAPGQNGSGNWGAILAWGDFLIATSSPVELPDKKDATASSLDDALQPTRYSSASRQLVVMDRHTGQTLWQREAESSFRHNCIVAAAGKLFCLDGMSPKKIEELQRRGVTPPSSSRLLALDLTNGNEVWSASEDVVGTFLNYSNEHDILIAGGSAYRDRASDEIDRGMVAYRGGDGTVVWKDPDLRYNGPCLLWKDQIITNGTGGFRIELLTGRRTEWSFSRMYGCNTIIGSQNLLTFRSGAAGFCDLLNDSGTGNIGGFRSSCTSNLIVADGVLCAPEYTRTCDCAYQLQTSLALVHMPEADLWTFNRPGYDESHARRLGVNFGAPGDRRAPNGTLWLDYPEVGGPSPELGLTVSPEEPTWYREHTSTIAAGDLPWVAASGGEGIETVTLKLRGSQSEARPYTVRLYFAEPDDAVQPGERQFSIQLQGQTVASDVDVCQLAGGARRTVVQEFHDVAIGNELVVQLTPHDDGSKPRAILSGLEIVANEQPTE